jgi:hypothetical protein
VLDCLFYPDTYRTRVMDVGHKDHYQWGGICFVDIKNRSFLGEILISSEFYVFVLNIIWLCYFYYLNGTVK